jgi:hypothetical protein
LHQPFQTTFGWSFLRSSTSERPFVGGAEGHQNDLLLVSFGAFKRLLVGQTPVLNDFLIQCQQTALLCEISAAFQRLIVGSYHCINLFKRLLVGHFYAVRLLNDLLLAVQRGIRTTFCWSALVLSNDFLLVRNELCFFQTSVDKEVVLC